jgi:uncharacterized protein YdhG (YjbR/CyaY superfamily)
MPTKNSKTESDGFSAEERAAMKERAAELRAEGKKGAKKADGLHTVLDRIAEMAPQDRALAERVHMTVTGTAPELTPKTWYGMPAYANADGKVVVFFQDAASSTTDTRPWASRTRPTSTTATCGRCLTRSNSGAPQWNKELSSW